MYAVTSTRDSTVTSNTRSRDIHSRCTETHGRVTAPSRPPHGHATFTGSRHSCNEGEQSPLSYTQSRDSTTSTVIHGDIHSRRIEARQSLGPLPCSRRHSLVLDIRVSRADRVCCSKPARGTGPSEILMDRVIHHSGAIRHRAPIRDNEGCLDTRARTLARMSADADRRP